MWGNSVGLLQYLMGQVITPAGVPPGDSPPSAGGKDSPSHRGPDVSEAAPSSRQSLFYHINYSLGSRIFRGERPNQIQNDFVWPLPAVIRVIKYDLTEAETYKSLRLAYPCQPPVAPHPSRQCHCGVNKTALPLWGSPESCKQIKVPISPHSKRNNKYYEKAQTGFSYLP